MGSLVQVGDLVRNCKLVEAMSDAPLLEAFDKIVEKSILSVPIYSVEKQNYIGVYWPHFRLAHCL